MKSTMGTVEPLYAIKQASLALVILGITKHIISIGLVFLYRHIKDFEHVAHLHDASRFEVTQNDFEVKSMLESGEVQNRGTLFRQSVRPTPSQSSTGLLQ